MNTSINKKIRNAFRITVAIFFVITLALLSAWTSIRLKKSPTALRPLAISIIVSFVLFALTAAISLVFKYVEKIEKKNKGVSNE